ncbi:MAG: 3-phosphoshikimate 1-carboxyvinyltransferase [Paramuribaculum sp.]|nr:3-phosphoshikimate 1-carboxyvinyltransferase [Paramuribaculum sp.]
MRYRIFPPEELMDVEITLPLSKSISNRVLIINALTPGSDPLSSVAYCDDTDVMLAALSSQTGEVNIGAAGTAMRFLTAYFAVQPGREVILTGSERMCNRPIAPLVDALKSIGADISYAAKEGFPPLVIKGKCLAGGEVRIDAGVSSQYISALMMIAPVLEKGLTITLEGDVISMPYIRMTAHIMECFGVSVNIDGNTITIPHSTYTAPKNFEVEADWSAASYWFEIQALTCGWTTLKGLHEKSCQGDSAIVELFRELGVETGFEESPLQAVLEASPDLAPRFVADLSSTPDVAQTFAVTCSMLGVPFRLSGLRSLRIKETDRIAALYNELLKVGVILETEGDEVISWDGIRRPVSEIPAFDTYSDHRMALSLAPAAIFIPGIIINDAEVVTKSYPGYWDDLRKAGFTVEEYTAEAE